MQYIQYMQSMQYMQYMQYTQYIQYSTYSTCLSYILTLYSPLDSVSSATPHVRILYMLHGYNMTVLPCI
jgi:hypothetical protein